MSPSAPVVCPLCPWDPVPPSAVLSSPRALHAHIVAVHDRLTDDPNALSDAQLRTLLLNAPPSSCTPPASTTTVPTPRRALYCQDCDVALLSVQDIREHARTACWSADAPLPKPKRPAGASPRGTQLDSATGRRPAQSTVTGPKIDSNRNNAQKLPTRCGKRPIAELTPHLYSQHQSRKRDASDPTGVAAKRDPSYVTDHTKKRRVECSESPLSSPTGDGAKPGPKSSTGPTLHLLSRSRGSNVKPIAPRLARHACTVPGCGKTFSRKDALLKHDAAKHSGRAKRFACPICGEQFTSRYDLTRHDLRVHSGLPKKFTCDGCGAGFSQKSQMTMHKQRVHVNCIPASEATQRPTMKRATTIRPRKVDDCHCHPVSNVSSPLTPVDSESDLDTASLMQLVSPAASTQA